MEKILNFLRRLFCHHNYQFFCNIGGDRINYISTSKIYRSLWRCTKCGKLKYRQQLVNCRKFNRHK